MAMNRVAESYSTQNKRNEKLRWRARRDETYKNNGLNFFLKENAYNRQGVTGYLKIGGQVLMPRASSILTKTGWAISHSAPPPLTPLKHIKV